MRIRPHLLRALMDKSLTVSMEISRVLPVFGASTAGNVGNFSPAGQRSLTAGRLGCTHPHVKRP